MIGYIKGDLLYAEDGVAVVETGGVGYEITCSAAVLRELIKNGGGEVFVYTALKEDGISLYGFESREEKRAFINLISVSGVGPKMGVAVLSVMNASELATKIAKGDVKGLSAVKGLGKKTAERIILELKDKFSVGKAEDDGGFTEIAETTEADDDALIALTGLGFTRAECDRAIRKAKADGAVTVQQVIAFALKNMR